jgi:2-polyprenyl-3-methyl-5-hydroxy-6-metoxy-1,4-benzoquinol methylase
MSKVDPRFFYDSVAEKFESLDSAFDVERRLAVVFDDLSQHVVWPARLVLDAGCGYGAFSVSAQRRGARVVSCDIGARLVSRTCKATGQLGVVADAIQLPFRDGVFDVVISSEMIEHTGDPLSAVRELLRVVTPGGWLVLTTPNRVWQPIVRLASKMALRPFHGLESFCHWNELERVARECSALVRRHIGFHALPFQFRLHRLTRMLDQKFGESGGARFFVNQAVLYQRSGPRSDAAGRPARGDTAQGW